MKTHAAFFLEVKSFKVVVMPFVFETRQKDYPQLIHTVLGRRAESGISLSGESSDNPALSTESGQVNIHAVLPQEWLDHVELRYCHGRLSSIAVVLYTGEGYLRLHPKRASYESIERYVLECRRLRILSKTRNIREHSFVRAQYGNEETK
ncbi:MAG: hypothetical protein IJL38_05990 [Bacteroidales bacterium]|nr:hypothetical protein [Bacteroidales bacterium]